MRLNIVIGLVAMEQSLKPTLTRSAIKPKLISVEIPKIKRINMPVGIGKRIG